MPSKNNCGFISDLISKILWIFLFNNFKVFLKKTYISYILNYSFYFMAFPTFIIIQFIYLGSYWWSFISSVITFLPFWFQFFEADEQHKRLEDELRSRLEVLEMETAQHQAVVDGLTRKYMDTIEKLQNDKAKLDVSLKLQIPYCRTLLFWDLFDLSSGSLRIICFKFKIGPEWILHPCIQLFCFFICLVL